ncbi:hypothetical protein EAH89_15615 [Roseomonas nepalensis]|uniref:Uncharacterized protein n=1 Tax=Muricoccus nepalensis TaxID=1854500 RepID=A0A502FVW7_9PROT|nr:hypothetical protein [Roseomonas nepalensis]TPG53635.1 hypothetical protein EAH89_15615 [Roseomonas nepalensis]
MTVSPAVLALLAALAPGMPDAPALATPWLPVRAPPVAHLSPDGRLMVLLERDDAFGQVETLTVFADPNTRWARRIFRSVGDTPLRFLRWQEARTAELEFPPQDGEPAYRLRLACGNDTCTLNRAPVEGRR